MRKEYIFKPLLLLFFVMIFCTSNAFAANQSLTMEINGKIIKPDADPFIVNNVTMVPLRFASEPLSADLLWDNDLKQATLNKDNMTVQITLGNKIALVNGVEKELLAAAVASNGRIFVPVRFIAENLGATVNWLPQTRTVQIIYSNIENTISVTGYYYDYNSLTMLEDYTDTFDDVIHFAYSVDATGCVNKKVNYDKDLFQCDACDILDNFNIRRQALVSCFDSTVSSTLLNDASLRKIAIENIVNMLKEDGYCGVDLDFESVSPASRDNFTAFVKELDQAFGSKYTLSLSLRPKSNDSQTWLDGYDYASLSKYADKMIVMLYNQHYAGGTPGAVAGIDWMETTIQYLLQYIPEEKFYAGLGAYGYSWLVDGGGGTSIHIKRAYELAEKYGSVIQRDETTGVPWFYYVNDLGESRVLWFEDAYSMGQKAALVKEYGLAGVAVWRMGIVPDDVWEAVISAIEE